MIKNKFNSKLYLVLILAIVSSLNTFAQKKKKQSSKEPILDKKYAFAEVSDSAGAITFYWIYVNCLGGDSIRVDRSGAKLQGWKEDQYLSGKLLHKGFYKEGQLELFRNYFENGKVERVFAKIDSLQSNLEVFYESGNQRQQFNYQGKKIKRLSEFYPNNLLKLTEEYDPKNDVLMKRKTWYASGQINSELVLKDAKNKRYILKTYHQNGKLAMSGEQVLNTKTLEFNQVGNWIQQDSLGRAVKKNSSLTK